MTYLPRILASGSIGAVHRAPGSEEMGADMIDTLMTEARWADEAPDHVAWSPVLASVLTGVLAEKKKGNAAALTDYSIVGLGGNVPGLLLVHADGDEIIVAEDASGEHDACWWINGNDDGITYRNTREMVLSMAAVMS